MICPEQVEAAWSLDAVVMGRRAAAVKGGVARRVQAVAGGCLPAAETVRLARIAPSLTNPVSTAAIQHSAQFRDYRDVGQIVCTDTHGA